MTKQNNSDFGPIRSILWPIYRHELSLVLPMILMLFLTCFNYYLLRNLKDVLVVTAASSGGEIIPFIKFWAMLPMAVLSAFIFTRLSNRFSQENVYYMMVGGFLFIYAIFGFIIYPMRESLELVSFSENVGTYLPAGMSGFVAMVRHWSLTFFYVICELWSSIVLTVLFWGFANEITKVKEASRWYSVFAVIASCSAIFAGELGEYITKLEYNPALPFGSDPWEQTVQQVILTVLLMGAGILVSFWWVNKYVLNSPKYEGLHNSVQFKIKKKQSLRDSFAFLMRSRYLICIAVIVVSYNLVMNLVEVVWKDQLKELHPGTGDYFSYLNNQTIYLGVLSTLAAFFVGKFIVWFGWSRTALITPVILLVTSLGFFGFLFFNEISSDNAVQIMGMSPLAFAVFFGLIQTVLSKSGKYSVFDATKEMAFIPLDHDVKLKGKAAIDGVGSRLGKSGGSVVHQSLLMIFGSLTSCAPYIAAILFVVIVAWMVAVKVLGVEFANLARKRHDEAAGITDNVEPGTAVPV